MRSSWPYAKLGLLRNDLDRGNTWPFDDDDNVDRATAPIGPPELVGYDLLAAGLAGPLPGFAVPPPPPGVVPRHGNAAAVTPPVNPVNDVADRAMLADVARSQFGVTGAGVRIGILSDSFDVRGGYATDVASGALPAGVTILQEGPATGSDEGRAMAQLIHQIAPDAQIDFYTAFRGELDFANGIIALANAGCQIIVDDVT
ncbi:S8/S53 family peptidase [Limobrevibacterium gyesilva]|uniref:Uncharacterized protein n=1 Tax=Limobrevibacterium gyesilva TaxID=2991712 RepID=A0AA41YUH1_9PROT|nr:hypothetical protein [Limobrevibacterium gyesilva]MCW3476725.1 hypothetical protein [Limobrevibacterium gyesilva]